MDCRTCQRNMEKGYFREGRFILGDIPKRFLRTSIWRKQSGFAMVFRCPQCGELKFVVPKIE